MKTLQNNHTTPEQSKRLLELGVPADSADFIYLSGYSEWKGDKMKLPFYIAPGISFSSQYKKFVVECEWNEEDIIPCWSVGRLMEIYDICCVTEEVGKEEWCSYRRLHRGQTYMDYLMFVFTTNKMKDLLDFSKLEE